MAWQGIHSHQNDDTLDRVPYLDDDTGRTDKKALVELIRHSYRDVLLSLTIHALELGVMPDKYDLGRALVAAQYKLDNEGQAKLGFERYVAIMLEARAIKKALETGVPELVIYKFESAYGNYTTPLTRRHLDALHQAIQTNEFPLDYLEDLPDGFYFEDRWFDSVLKRIARKALLCQPIRALLGLLDPNLPELKYEERA